MTATQAEVLRALGSGVVMALELIRLPGVPRGSMVLVRLRDKGFVEVDERDACKLTPTGARALELWDELVELEETR